VVKTVATAPGARGLGLGGHMLDLIRQRARALGGRGVIHALMHVDNFSMRMSARHRTRVFRRYALYQWTP
jgi:GNAT superfamily N-acetyltransferase